MNISFQEETIAAKPKHPSAETDVFEAIVISAKRLTNDPLVKKTLQLELDTSVSTNLFSPGFTDVFFQHYRELELKLWRIAFSFKNTENGIFFQKCGEWIFLQ